MRAFRSVLLVACVALVIGAMAVPASAVVVYDQVVNINFGREGVAPYTNANGVGAAVDSGTIWNDHVSDIGTGYVGPMTFSDQVDSLGNATTVDLNETWEFISQTAKTNALYSGYFYHGNFVGGSATPTFSISDVEVGRTYDLFFYMGGPNDMTVATTGGVAATDSATGSSMPFDPPFANPVHSDWVEGTHYLKLTATATETSITGQFTLAVCAHDAGDNRWMGVQIARVNEIPEPSTLVLLGAGLLGLLAYAWRKRK